jgi:hypothetical protein
MNTRKLLALGIALAFTSLAGAGFAADQKAAAPAPTAPAATTAQAPAGDQGTPAKPSKSKKQKHKKAAPAPETKG